MEITKLPVRGFYHICSDGNYSFNLFRNQKDFKSAMNRIAVVAHKYSITILAFVLMDNHFHFVVQSDSAAECISFVNEFKRLTGKYIADYYHEHSAVSQLPVQVIPVPDQDYLKTLICYVIKNPTVARTGMFYSYPWSSGNLYFAQPNRREARRLGEMSENAIRQMCGTHAQLPADWLITNGIILPENYIPVSAVEQLFKTPRSFMYFLALNKDDEIERDFGEWSRIRLADAELRTERNAMSMAMFGTDRIRDLSGPDRIKLGKRLWRKFLCPKKQIARIVMLPISTIEQNL